MIDRESREERERESGEKEERALDDVWVAERKKYRRKRVGSWEGEWEGRIRINPPSSDLAGTTLQAGHEY